MKIEKLGVRITDVPFFDAIQVIETGIVIEDEGRNFGFEVHQVKQMRDALTAAIEAAEQMAGQGAAPEFTVGQLITNSSAVLPVGTVIRDNDPEDGPDEWVSIAPDAFVLVRYKDNSDPQTQRLAWLIEKFGYPTIVNLP